MSRFHKLGQLYACLRPLMFHSQMSNVIYPISKAKLHINTTYYAVKKTTSAAGGVLGLGKGKKKMGKLGTMEKKVLPVESDPEKLVHYVCGSNIYNTGEDVQAACDWTIMMDTYEKQYRIPEDIVVSSSRPDIFLYSRQLKRVILVELTVPWETNIPKDHTFKIKPDSEYPSWLWSLRVGRAPSIEDLDPTTKQYWLRVRTEGMRRNNRLRAMRKF